MFVLFPRHDVRRNLKVYRWRVAKLRSWMWCPTYAFTIYHYCDILCHNGRDGVSNHQPHDCLLNPLFRRRSNKTSKSALLTLCEGNSPVTGEFPTQRASNTENVSIWWRHHGCSETCLLHVATCALTNRDSHISTWANVTTAHPTRS